MHSYNLYTVAQRERAISLETRDKIFVMLMKQNIFTYSTSVIFLKIPRQQQVLPATCVAQIDPRDRREGMKPE
jgi:hypothetical protein